MGFLDTIGTSVSLISDGLDIADKIRNWNVNPIKRNVKWAKKAGIHPLAALGINPASGSSVQTFGQIGQNIRENLSNDRTLTRKLIGAQINETEAKAEYWRSMADNSAPGQSSPAVSGNGSNTTLGIAGQNTSVSGGPPGVQFTDNQVPVSSSLGTQAGTIPIEQQAVTKYGTVYRIPNQANQEGISEGSIFTQIKYNLGQIADYLAGYASVYNEAGFTKKFQQTKEYLLSDRPQSGGGGKEFRYNVFRGSWVLRTIGPEGNQIWDHAGLWNQYGNLPRSNR